jgi:glycosyltransferase involved in cell wall biosynthesis
MSSSVLWVSREVPDRTGHGGQRRQYHLLQSLLRAGIEVEVAVPHTDQRRDSVAALTKVTALPAVSLRRGAMVGSAFDDLVRRSKPDHLLVVHPVSLGLVPRSLVGSRPNLVVDVQNVDSRWLESRREWRQARRLRRWERLAVRRGTTVACTEEERAELQRLSPRSEVILVRQGFDPEEWPVHPPRAEGDSVRFAFFGSLWYDVNTEGLDWFLANVWDGVRRALPNAELMLFGPGDGSRFVDPARGIRIEGWVEDLAAGLATTDVVVLPILAGPGSRVKFPEALASGVPVVATSAAADSFDAAGAFITADDPAAFQDACVRLGSSGSERLALADAARSLASRSLTWSSCARPLVDLLVGQR